MNKVNLPKKLRVMADYSSSGIWVMEPVLGFRHGMIDCRSLGLPEELSNRFKDWIEMYDNNLNEKDLKLEEFDRIGLQLAKDLKKFLGPETYVEYEPEKSSSGEAMMEVINREYAKINPIQITWLRIIDYIMRPISMYIKGSYTTQLGRKLDEIMSKPETLKKLGELKEQLSGTVVID